MTSKKGERVASLYYGKIKQQLHAYVWTEQNFDKRLRSSLIEYITATCTAFYKEL